MSSALIKMHGGKAYLRKWITSYFPEHKRFVDVFGGGGSIILEKDPCEFEVYNDIDIELYSLFVTVKHFPVAFMEKLKTEMYSEETFERYKAKNIVGPVDGTIWSSESNRDWLRAIRAYVVHRMSRGGMCKDFAWSERLRGGKPGDLNAWENSIPNIASASKRLQNVVITNDSFESCFQKFDSSDALFYCDPPYAHSTRVSKKAYDHEMSFDDHIRLLSILRGVKGKVVLSGYDSDLYNSMLPDWKTATKEIVNHSSQRKTKERKREKLWINF